MFFLLTDPINSLPGIGPNLSQKLAKIGLFCIADLIHYYPRKWEDFSQILPISKLLENQPVTVQAKLTAINQFRTYRQKMTLTTAIVSDGSGNLPIIWFNQPYLINTLREGQSYFFSGTAKRHQGKLTLVSPVYEAVSLTFSPLHSGRIVPIYPETLGITSKLLRKLARYLIPTTHAIPETLPPEIIAKYKLMPRAKALENIHFPNRMLDLAPAKTRLSFEELIPIHLSLILEKKRWANQSSQPIPINPKFLQKFISALDFKLTPSQITAIKQILSDLTKNQPTNRLLLGDVGSGKTVVAASALIASAKAGFQSALMAPTEILANQHYHYIQPLLKKFGITATLITGHTKLHSYADIASGKIAVIIGTHALIQQKLTFANLNLVIVDEQHRFGVHQRQKLTTKTETVPHYLSLSATPIPRTLFLSLLKDVQVSYLTHLPKGRLPIITRLSTPRNFTRVQELVLKEIAQHHPVFVIVPRINLPSASAAEANDKASVMSERTKLTRLFPTASIGILHGQMPSEVKLKTMADLKTGKLDILVSTSVIEVGIDIPEATVVWIKNAEQFGLAGLHQLRGRVGRSHHQSYCLIETASANPEVISRLIQLIKTNDGRKLAEIDFKLRGPGSFFGGEQSGWLKLKLADLTKPALIKATRAIAETILAADPNLKHYPAYKNELKFNYLTHSE